MSRGLAFIIAVLLSVPCYGQDFVYFKKKAAAGGGYTACTLGTAFFCDNFNRNNSETIGGGWTSESDTGSLLSIASSKLLLTHSAQTNAYAVYNLTSNKTEIWFQFSINISKVTGCGAYTTLWPIIIKESGGPSAIANLIISNTSGGNIYYIIAGWFNEVPSGIESSAYTWIPSADTDYTIKIHLKAATNTSSNDGIFDVYVDGTRQINVTNADMSRGNMDFNLIELGNTSSAFTCTDISIKYDDFSIRGDDAF